MKLADRKNCTGCMACVDVCSHNVLKPHVDKDGYFVIAADEQGCVNCGMCSKVCPILNKPKTHSNGTSIPYAAWNTNLSQRKASASGGIFAALAYTVLRLGGVVYGATIAGFDVVHKRVSDVGDLPQLQGSKYQHSNICGIYRQVKKDLVAGRMVLFSGLGCQIAGLLSFLGNTDKEHLYTVDTICGGLSTMLPMIQLKGLGKYRGISSFRDKENGWQSTGFRYSLKMICNDGSIADLGLDNLVLNTFSSKLLKRSSCLDCKFVGCHRISDGTIGDFWGDTRFREQHRDGLSVFIVHNERIMTLVGESNMETVAVSWKEVLANNRNIYWTHYPAIRYFPSRKKALRAIREKNYQKAASQISPWSFSGLLLRIYLKLNTLHRIISAHLTVGCSVVREARVKAGLFTPNV